MGNSGSSSIENSDIGAPTKKRWGKVGRRRGRSTGEMALDDFQTPKGFVSNIGVGGFGKVLALEKKDDTSRKFAVKCMHKGKIIKKGYVENCMNELAILRRMDHYAYLCNLYYAFQDRNYLYMCTDLMLGGTLQRALKKAPGHNFSDQPEKICQYAAELTLALQFLHSQNVVHRDIKPDNILLDANGHLHLTDFNVSLFVPPGNEETQGHVDGWGSSGYRAPEVYLRTGVGFIFACDWWSLGALVYQMHVGTVPYRKITPDEPSTELLIRMNSECADFSKIKAGTDAQDFVKELLRFNPEQRLGCQHGCNSEVMIMCHPYFGPMDWDALERYKPTNFASEDAHSRNNTSNSEVSSGERKNQAQPQVVDMRDFADNFDATLDQKEKLRILQRNMGILGLDGLDGDDDEEDYPSVRPDQQYLFQDWNFNVDFKLEQQAKPQFTLLQTVSSMSPEQIKSWIQTSTPESLKALCSEIKEYREQAMKENFDHVMAEMRIDKLIEENLALTRRVAELEKRLGIPSTKLQGILDGTTGTTTTGSVTKPTTDEVVLFNIENNGKSVSSELQVDLEGINDDDEEEQADDETSMNLPANTPPLSLSRIQKGDTDEKGSSPGSILSPGFISNTDDDESPGFRFQKM